MRKLSVDNLKNGIVTRGILIDMPRLKNLPWLEPGTPVFVEDLEAWEKQAGQGRVRRRDFPAHRPVGAAREARAVERGPE